MPISTKDRTPILVPARIIYEMRGRYGYHSRAAKISSPIIAAEHMKTAALLEKALALFES